MVDFILLLEKAFPFESIEILINRKWIMAEVGSDKNQLGTNFSVGKQDILLEYFPSRKF